MGGGAEAFRRLLFAKNDSTTLNVCGKSDTMNSEKEGSAMKILLKILFAPVIAVLSIFIWLAAKIVQAAAIVLNFIAVATALGAICILIDGRTAHGIAGLIAAFLLTPFGLPLLSIILLGQVQKFKCWLQDRVYG